MTVARAAAAVAVALAVAACGGTNEESSSEWSAATRGFCDHAAQVAPVSTPLYAELEVTESNVADIRTLVDDVGSDVAALDNAGRPADTPDLTATARRLHEPLTAAADAVRDRSGREVALSLHTALEALVAIPQVPCQGTRLESAGTRRAMSKLATKIRCTQVARMSLVADEIRDRRAREPARQLDEIAAGLEVAAKLLERADDEESKAVRELAGLLRDWARSGAGPDDVPPLEALQRSLGAMSRCDS